MNPRSLAFRLTAWYTLLLGATFILVAAVTFYGLQHYLRSNAQDSLRRRVAEVEQILRRAPVTTADDAIAQEVELHLAPEANNRFVRVTRFPGKVVYLSGPPSDGSFNRFDVAARLPAGSTKTAAEFVSTLLPDQHLIVGATSIDTVSGRYVLEIGSSMLAIETALARLTDLLGVLLPTLIGCAAVGAYLLVTWALRPVDRLSQTAEQISLQNLSLRLPVVATGDALERLSISLNNMLGRLRDSVQSSRRFLADASHELRTPLTVIKGELQELSSEAGLTGDAMRERVGSVLEEVARLEHLVSGLLMLSRLDAGETQRERTELDLAELARSTAEQMRLMAEDRGISIELSGLLPAVIQGDRSRIKQIIVNLLDNAIRFTPARGSVILRTTEDAGYALLEVMDTGIGIPKASLPHVFERFYRADEARSRDDGGAGLGLSIVRSICSMHGADIEVSSRLGEGSCFRVRFPRRPVSLCEARPAAGSEGLQPSSAEQILGAQCV
ncbi:MAG TPA: ATP-binding protein [Steroidobacteraceae bacterium]|nr:ATP-binding protein [Steroidobacteraceae bacterium]